MGGKHLNKNTNIRVTIDGDIFENSKASTTFVEVIDYIINNVEFNNINDFNSYGKPIISNDIKFFPEYARTQVHKKGEYFVNCHSSTNEKKRIIDEILSKYNLVGNVEIVDSEIELNKQSIIDIIDISKRYKLAKENDNELLKFINNIDKSIIEKNVDRLLSCLKEKSYPVIEFRYELSLLLQQRNITKEDLISLKDKVDKKFDKKVFLAWSNFSLCYDLEYYYLKEDVRKTLKTFSEYLVNKNEYNFNVKIVDFYGSANFGSDSSWIALYNNTHKNQNEAKQFFIQFENGKMKFGLYYDPTKKHTDTMEFGSNEIDIDFVVEHLKKYTQTIKNDNIKTQRTWIFSPGNCRNINCEPEKWEEFYNYGIMGVGWDKLGDLNQYKDKNTIYKKLKDVYEHNNPNSNALANFEFKNVMAIGDIVICKKGRNQIIGYGIVDSDYFFDDSRESYKSCRKVKWLKKGDWNTDKKLALKTLTDITKYPEDVEKIYDIIDFQNENENIEDDYKELVEDELEIIPVIHPLYMAPNTNTIFPEGLGSLCITGDSGVGKTYRIEETFNDHNIEIVIPSISTTGLLTQFSTRKKDYIPGVIGEILIDAAKNVDKLYTIILDEIHKDRFIDMINDELLQCISTKRNSGRYLPKMDSETDQLFSDLELNKGRRKITDNVGFVFITSNEDAIDFNKDFKNRIEKIKLEHWKLEQADFTIDFLLSKIEESENENDVEG